MDPVFEEESRVLDKKINDIKGCIRELRNTAMAYKTTAVENGVPITSAEMADIYEACLGSPYYARMDIESKGNNGQIKSESLYIGKQGVHDGTDSIVIDWRAPIAGFYTQTSDIKFSFEGVDYELTLRRDLDIRKSRLVGYKTLYALDSDLEGDVIDPFLRTVLKDKRREKKLTDIIRTIQENQNLIIRKPLKESFVCQGCAGSGKTMILLHRLSVLKYNNKNLSPSTIRIITPNKDFDRHIDDLSRQLELDKIKRLTVEELYADLIGKIKRTNEKISAEIISEKTIDEQLMRDIYSEAFQNKLLKEYIEYWTSAINALNANGLTDYYRKKNAELPNLSKKKISTYRSLASFISSEIAKETAAKELNDKEKYKNDLLGRIEKSAKKTEDYLQALKPAGEQVQEALGVICEKLNKLSASLTDASNENNRLLSDVKQKIERYSEIESIIEAVESARRIIKKPGDIGKLSVPVRSLFEKYLQPEISETEALKAQIDALPIYNFGKRNSLRSKLNVLYSEFEKKAEAAAEDIITDYKAQIGADEDLPALKKQRENLEEELGSLNIRIDLQKKYIEKAEAINSVLTDGKFCAVDFAEFKDLYPEYAELFAFYSKQAGEYSLENEEYERMQRELAETETRITDLREERKSNLSVLEKLLPIVEQLRYPEINRRIKYRNIRELFKKYKVTYKGENYQYRFKLYTELLFAALYYERAFDLPTMLNIDEAQDISVAEYNLLHYVFGKSCTYNLYGDVNQVVYDYKGVTDWEDISQITGGKVSVLNENYRNTVEITKYCNDEFGAGITAIGISGESVKELDLKEAIKRIESLHRTEPESRIAVIYRTGIRSIRAALNSILSAGVTSWDKVEDNKISVITAETAKGLEFDTVVAVTDQMEDNEKYISYTRALERLYVVKDRFEKNREEEYTEEPENEPLPGIAFPGENNPVLINYQDVDSIENLWAKYHVIGEPFLVVKESWTGDYCLRVDRFDGDNVEGVRFKDGIFNSNTGARTKNYSYRMYKGPSYNRIKQTSKDQISLWDLV